MFILEPHFYFYIPRAFCPNLMNIALFKLLKPFFYLIDKEIFRKAGSKSFLLYIISCVFALNRLHTDIEYSNANTENFK